MKKIWGKQKTNQSAVRMLFLSLAVLCTCLSICLVHMSDIKAVFQSLKIRETYQNVQNVERVIADDIDSTSELIEQAASFMTEDVKHLCNYDIFEIIYQYRDMEKFESIYYMTNDAQVYTTEGEILKIDEESISQLNDLQKAKCFVTREENAEKCPGVLYYVAPVFLEGERRGFFIGAQNVCDCLEGAAFDYVKEYGDVFLVDVQGKIYAKAMDQYECTTDDFFEFLRLYSADSYSKERVSKVKWQLKKDGYGKCYTVDYDGMTNYVEMMSVSGVDKMYLAYIYPETVITDIINPVIYESLITCLFIIMITLGMLFFMWATSKKAGDMIELLAYGDQITGGKNDNYFRMTAPNILAENANVPYLVTRFDVSNFRYINEAYGHVRADELLTIIVKESNRFFKNKELCTRMDSDQFVLLARNNQEYEARFEEMMGVINERAREIGIMFPIRLKRGIYQIRKDDIDINVIIDHANAARKSLVGDEKVLVAVYSDRIVQKMHVEEKIESEMEDALRNGEFKVFIQPKWDISKDRIYGGEALVRWIKEDGSMVFPDQFIPLFERNGFIEKLDLYMLEEVCKGLRKLIDSNREIFPISVNQSRILIHNPDYVNQVMKIIKRHRIPSGFIELEVTETVFFDERNMMIRTINQLKDMDVMISMDDFGSGYSSLNMLKDVPFDMIKIDRGFFSEMITSPASVMILRKIIEMAQGLGIRVLCEGVETAEQVEMLKELGCSYVQGYFYSKPIESKMFVRKYCLDKEGGKEYYDILYTKENEERNKRIRQQKEEQDALSVVETFKKKYSSTPKMQKAKTITDESGKILLATEQKVRASEAKDVKETKLSKDT